MKRIHRWFPDQISITAFCILLICSSFIFHYCGSKAQTDVTSSYSDSSKNNLQLVIDSVYNEISAYNDLLLRKEQLPVAKKELFDRHNRISDSLVRLDSTLESMIAGVKAKTPSKNIKKELRETYAEMFRLEALKREVAADSDKLLTSARELDKEIDDKTKKYTKLRELVKQTIEKLSGAGSIKVNNVSLRYFIARKGESGIYIHNPKKKNRSQSINEIINSLKTQHKEPLMVTNGGMFAPGYGPQGLLIENSKEIKGLDTANADNSGGNFYMQPNGVFFIDSAGSYSVTSTSEFKMAYRGKGPHPVFATQSGPMLINNKTLNQNFKRGSKNLNIRSGVGEMSHDKIVFLISDAGINFFDFALVFKEFFHCDNALYLDGAISQMYLNEKMFGIPNPNANDGAFGPVISVTKK